MIPANKAISFQKGFKTGRTTIDLGHLFMSSHIPECLIPFLFFTSRLRDHSKRPPSSQSLNLRSYKSSLYNLYNLGKKMYLLSEISLILFENTVHVSIYL